MRLILHGSRIRQICRHRCETINFWLQSLWGFEASWMWHFTVQKTDTNFCKNVVSVCSGQHNKTKPFFCFISLHFFFLFSLTHSFLYPPPNLRYYHHPLSFHSPAILIIPSNIRTTHFIFSITFNPENGDSIYLRNTYICLLNSVSRMPEDCSCSRHSAAC